MIKKLITFFKERRLPKDKLFHSREARPWQGFMITELGGAEHTLLLDTLHAICRSDSDDQTKGSQMLGLRLQALAYSLRTKSGRIPFDANDEKDLKHLACYPISQAANATRILSEISDIPWLMPADQDQEGAYQLEPEISEPEFENP